MSTDPEHAHVLAPPPLIFAAYTVIALVLNWLVPALRSSLTMLRVLGGLALLSGFVLAGLVFSQMIRARTSPDPDHPTTTLLTQGPYSFSRNPIYLGFFLVYLGFTLLAGTFWGIVLSPCVILTVNWAVIQREERYLANRFAGSYTSYKARVRRWL